MSALALDFETLYAELLTQVRALLARPEWVGAQLVGIWSGGAWLAQALQRDLGREGAPGVISSRLHRDDFAEREEAPVRPGLAPDEVRNLKSTLAELLELKRLLDQAR